MSIIYKSWADYSRELFECTWQGEYQEPVEDAMRDIFGESYREQNENRT